MKKQILILFLAVFALGATQAYAQAELAPRPLSDCIDLDNPLTPVPGQPYTYSVEVPTPPGNKIYHWVVTQDTIFIQNGVFDVTVEGFGGRFLATGSGHYDTPTDGPLNDATLTSINLTWQSFSLAEEEYVFVVFYVENLEECSDNLKVFRIEPLHAFTLDIANVDFGGDVLDYDTVLEQCISDVQSAVFNPDGDGGNGSVVYDFGSDTLYFAVAAANFSGQFNLGVQFDGLQGGQTAEYYWGYTFAEAEANTNVLNIGGFGDANIIGEADWTIGEAGRTIWIKIIIHHNDFEGVGGADFDYTLSVAGILYDGENNIDGTEDIRHDNCEVDLYHDLAIQTLTRRPEVTNPDPDFLPID